MKREEGSGGRGGRRGGRAWRGEGRRGEKEEGVRSVEVGEEEEEERDGEGGRRGGALGSSVGGPYGSQPIAARALPQCPVTAVTAQVACSSYPWFHHTHVPATR